MTDKWGGLVALLAGFFVLLLDTTIVAVASPSIQADLAADVAGLFWVTAGYLLAFSVPLLVAGRLGDLCDPKRDARTEGARCRSRWTGIPSRWRPS